MAQRRYDNESTQVGRLAGILAVMLVVSAIMLVWTKRKGWW